MRVAILAVTGLLIVPTFLLAAGQEDQTPSQAPSQTQSTAQPATPADGLPDGPGKDTFVQVCSNCHDTSVVRALRLPQSGWEQTVEDMQGRGAEGTDDQFTQIVAYLTKNFGPVNVNTATQAELQDKLHLPEKDAAAIIAYRDKNGKIKDFDELKAIPGLDPTQVQKRRSIISFSDTPPSGQ